MISTITIILIILIILTMMIILIILIMIILITNLATALLVKEKLQCPYPRTILTIMLIISTIFIFFIFFIMFIMFIFFIILITNLATALFLNRPLFHLGRGQALRNFYLRRRSFFSCPGQLNN